MNIRKAFIAGIVASAGMVLILAIAQALEASTDLPMLIGTMPGNTPSGAAWLMGFIVLMIGGGIGGIAYGASFEALTHRADALTGALMAVIPMLVEGLWLGFMDKMHPLIPKMMASPGFFMSNHGAMGVVAFVVSHLAFGAIVGSLYGPIASKCTSNYTPMDE